MIVPLPGWVLVRPQEITKRGMIDIPDSNKGQLTQGEVLAKGGLREVGLSQDTSGVLGVEVSDVPVEVGDIVAYRKYADHSIEDDGAEFKLVSFGNLLAIIK